MAIASCSVTIISRGKGRSAVAAAAYRAGQEMSNAYDGLVHNYTRKSGIIYKDILTPTGAPDWAHDRQKLWNMVEQTERRKDAQLAREVMIALPQELSPRQNIDLARDYAQRFVEQGMIADVSVHDSQDGNPHAHILLTMRPLEGDNFGKKCREWNAKEKLIEWREQYADLTNQYLERYGHDQRIDARSYADQGIDLIPTIHLGPSAHRIEQRGIQTDRGNINRRIQEANRQINEISREIALLGQDMERLQAEDLAHRLTGTEPGKEPSAPPPRTEPEPRGSQDKHRGSPHPYRPPPLHRHREERTLAGQRIAGNVRDRLRQPEPEREEPVHPNRPSPRWWQRALNFKQPEDRPTRPLQPPEPEQKEPAHQNRPPSRWWQRALNFGQPEDRPAREPQPSAQVKETPVHDSRPLPSGRHREHRFNEPNREQPTRQPPQSEAQDAPAHHRPDLSPEQQRRLSRKEQIARLVKEYEEQKEQNRDDTPGHEK